MYTNPRLKHVKAIEEIVDRMPTLTDREATDLLRHQCNLLLETKKRKKKCNHDWRSQKTSTSFVVCDRCGAMKSSIPTPKQSTEKCKHVSCNTIVTFEGKTKTHEKTTCASCGTIVGEANYPSPQPNKESKACLKCGGYKPDNGEIFSCSKICLCLEPEKCECGAKAIASNGQCMACLSTCPRKRVSPQPEIKPFDLKDGWASSISKRSLADKLNLVIEQVNRLTKTK